MSTTPFGWSGLPGRLSRDAPRPLRMWAARCMLVVCHTRSLPWSSEPRGGDRGRRRPGSASGIEPCSFRCLMHLWDAACPAGHCSAAQLEAA
jgi:hypothetical protein